MFWICLEKIEVKFSKFIYFRLNVLEEKDCDYVLIIEAGISNNVKCIGRSPEFSGEVL